MRKKILMWRVVNFLCLWIDPTRSSEDSTIEWSTLLTYGHQVRSLLVFSKPMTRTQGTNMLNLIPHDMPTVDHRHVMLTMAAVYDLNTNRTPTKQI